MAKQKRRPANDRALKVYKSTNRREKNKIRKLTRYVEKNPNDKQAAKALASIKNEGYKPKIQSRGTGQTLVDKWIHKTSKRLQREVDHMLIFGSPVAESAKPPLAEKLLAMGYEPIGGKRNKRGHRTIKKAKT